LPTFFTSNIANIKVHVHWQSFFAKMLATNYVLSLPTLGDMTQIGSLSELHHPKLSQQEGLGIIVLHNRRWIAA
jgi:hypothetical protein